MGKCCAINGCLSGRKSQKHIHKLSFFKVPKKPEILKKWSTAIAQELDPKNFVCELHFNKIDLNTEDRFTLGDGSVFVSKKCKVKVKPGSIPQLNLNVPKDGGESPPKNVIPTSDIDLANCSGSDDFGNNDIQQLCINDICNTLKMKPLPSNWSWMLELDEQFILLSYLDSTSLKPKCHIKIKKDLTVTMINACTGICIDLDVIIWETEMVWELLNNEKRYYFCCGTGINEKKCSSDCKGMQLSHQLLSDSKKEIPEYRCIPCQLYLNKEDLHKEDQYTGKHLIKDWKNWREEGKALSHWELCNLSYGIFFVYFGDDHKSSSRTIFVKEDMSLEIRHHGRLANLPVLEKITNFQDLLGVLFMVNNSQICEGLHNIPCKNVLFDPKPKSKSVKCTDCRKIRSKRKLIAWSSERRILLKQKKEQLYVANLKQKYKRAVNKIIYHVNQDESIL